MLTLRASHRICLTSQVHHQGHHGDPQLQRRPPRPKWCAGAFSSVAQHQRISPRCGATPLHPLRSWLQQKHRVTNSWCKRRLDSFLSFWTALRPHISSRSCLPMLSKKLSSLFSNHVFEAETAAEPDEWLLSFQSAIILCQQNPCHDVLYLEHL